MCEERLWSRCFCCVIRGSELSSGITEREEKKPDSWSGTSRGFAQKTTGTGVLTTVQTSILP